MKTNHRLLASFASLAVLMAASTLSGQALDTFDNSTNWLRDINGSTSTLSIVNGVAQYTADGTGNGSARFLPSTGGNGAIIGSWSSPMPAFTGSLTQSWSVQVDVHMAQGLATTAQSLEAGLQLLELQTATYGHGLNLSVFSAWAPRMALLNNWSVSWNTLTPADVGASATSLTDATLGISYDSTSKIMSFSVTSGADVYRFSSFNLTTGWGLNGSAAGDGVGIALFASSSTGVVVGAGEVTFDNFTYSGLNTSGAWPVYQSAVPEPSTYAAILGAVALVGGVWLRRKKR